MHFISVRFNGWRNYEEIVGKCGLSLLKNLEQAKKNIPSHLTTLIQSTVVTIPNEMLFEELCRLYLITREYNSAIYNTIMQIYARHVSNFCPPNYYIHSSSVVRIEKNDSEKNLKHSKEKIYILSEGIDELERICSKDILEKSDIFIYILCSNTDDIAHFSLLCLDKNKKQLLHYDSLLYQLDFKVLKSYFKEKNIDIQNFFNLGPSGLQQKSFDCSIYALCKIKQLCFSTFYDEKLISQENMDCHRRLILSELLEDQLYLFYP